jgi:hypothetical protein
LPATISFPDETVVAPNVESPPSVQLAFAEGSYKFQPSSGGRVSP